MKLFALTSFLIIMCLAGCMKNHPAQISGCRWEVTRGEEESLVCNKTGKILGRVKTYGGNEASAESWWGGPLNSEIDGFYATKIEAEHAVESRVINFNLCN